MVNTLTATINARYSKKSLEDTTEAFSSEETSLVKG
jgi:hypothetical protein